MKQVKPPRREMLLVNGREIPIAVVRSRRARRYVLRLRADGLAHLTIPRNGSAREAWEFVRRHQTWLERQLQYFASRPVRPREWRVGTEILFRGELVKIETASRFSFRSSARERAPISSRFISPSIDAAQPVKASADNSPGGRGANRPGGEGGRQTDFFSQLSSAASENSSNNEHVASAVQLGTELIPVADSAADLRPAIESHLWAMAEKELPAQTLQFAAMHQLSVRRVTVRAQRSRWGSCSFKGVISLNWRLIQTPPFVRDYIILHELMHLRQMNHSARFWKEVERVCPDYRRAKLWLRENPGLLDR